MTSFDDKEIRPFQRYPQFMSCFPFGPKSYLTISTLNLCHAFHLKCLLRLDGTVTSQDLLYDTF